MTGDGIMDYAYGGLSSAVDIWKWDRERADRKAQQRREADAAARRERAAIGLAKWDAANKKAIYQAMALAAVGGLGLMFYLKKRKRG